MWESKDLNLKIAEYTFINTNYLCNKMKLTGIYFQKNAILQSHMN